MTEHQDIIRMKRFIKLQHTAKFPWGKARYTTELHKLLASPGISEMTMETQSNTSLILDGKPVSHVIGRCFNGMTLRTWWEKEASKAGTSLFPTFEFSDDDVCEVVKLVPQPAAVVAVLDAWHPPTLMECKIMSPPNKAANKKIIWGNHFKPEWGDTVPAKAFINRHDIEEVEIPERIKYIGFRAFYNCQNLKRVAFTLFNKLNTIHQEAFDMCLQLEECVVPSGTKVEPNAFGHSTKIKKGTVIQDRDFPKEWGQVVPRSAFSWRLDIVKVELPPHIKKIEEFAFQGCSNLVDCPIMPDVEIGACVFHRCSKHTVVLSGRNNMTETPKQRTSVAASAVFESDEDENLYD